MEIAIVLQTRNITHNSQYITKQVKSAYHVNITTESTQDENDSIWPNSMKLIAINLTIIVICHFFFLFLCRVKLLIIPSEIKLQFPKPQGVPRIVRQHLAHEQNRNSLFYSVFFDSSLFIGTKTYLFFYFMLCSILLSIFIKQNKTHMFCFIHFNLSTKCYLSCQ